MKVGQEIPDLEFEYFQNEEVKTANLKDYRGKWLVLLFYPKDFTFVCPTELAEAADLYDQFKEQGAEIISISTDTAYVHKAWHDHSESIKKVNYPMAADPTHIISKKFGTYIKEEGISNRASFIIDPEGKVVHLEMHADGIGRNNRETLRKLKAAAYVHEHPEQACPVNWEPGKETLRPGVDLVGKI